MAFFLHYICFHRLLSESIRLFLILLFFIPQPAQAAERMSELLRLRYMDVSLEAETANPAPGSEVTLALAIMPHKGWHDYWLNPGEIGLAPNLKWNLPAGITISEARFPPPETLTTAKMTNYVYSRPHALLFSLNIPEDWVLGQSIPVALSANWLVCSDKLCVPEAGDLAIDLIVGDGHVTSKAHGRFDRWRQELPVPLAGDSFFAKIGNKIHVSIPYPRDAKLAKPWLFPEKKGIIKPSGAQDFKRIQDHLIVTALAVEESYNNPTKEALPQEVSWVLATGNNRALSIRSKAKPSSNRLPFFDQAKLTDNHQMSQGYNILLALGGAILGGLLLNILPCVFPIVGLKALSLTRSALETRVVRTEAASYTLGAVAVTTLLGATALILRAGGETVGWAFQLQSPKMIFILLLLFVAITANLIQVFELPSIGGGMAVVEREGVLGAFSTGALAAFVATPCTGPFMAAALGAALILPALPALVIFAGLGFGMSLPFLLLAFFPILRSKLPKPGKWMNSFRKLMAIPMGLSALALLWLLWRQIALSGLVIGILASSLLLIGLIVLGRLQRTSHKPKFSAHIMLAIAVIGGSILIAQQPTPIARPGNFADSALKTEYFTTDKLAELRQENHRVFVYFTADWCVTCKINERTVLENDSVIRAFEKAKVKSLIGDLTLANAKISQFMRQHARSGIPLYLYYAPGADKPIILPQILTPGMLLDLVED